MSQTMGVDYKDKDEAVPYTVNWAPELDNGATISTVSWSTGGLTNQSVAQTDTVASIRLAGGTPGHTYRVECTITASDGAIYEVGFLVTVDN